MLKEVGTLPPNATGKTSLTRRPFRRLEGVGADGGVPVEFVHEGVAKFLHPAVLVEVE